MRDIKFRGYDRKANAMFPVHRMDFGKISNELGGFYGVDIHHKDSDRDGDVSYGGNVNKMTGSPLKPRFEIMQFTGLKDKNGREIYEGDIVQGKTDIFDRMTGQVTFAGTGYVIDGVGKYKRIREELYNYYEVIGNIYENPELMEASSQ